MIIHHFSGVNQAAFNLELSRILQQNYKQVPVSMAACSLVEGSLTFITFPFFLRIKYSQSFPSNNGKMEDVRHQAEQLKSLVFKSILKLSYVLIPMQGNCQDALACKGGGRLPDLSGATLLGTEWSGELRIVHYKR